MAVVQCKVDIPAVSGLEDQQITVGREFYLKCTGEWPRGLNPDKVRIASGEAIKYQLKLLGFEFRNPNEADLKVTSYLAGPHQFANLVVTDDAQSVELESIKFEVQSVLPKGEKVEPYGAIGPATIPVPLLYWLVLGGSILLVGLLIGLRVWRYQQRKAMLERLKEHDLAATPIQQFHQSMRKLQRTNFAFYGKEAPIEDLQSGTEDLDKMFKIYLSRRLRVPAFEWNERLVLADIRRYHRKLYDEYAVKLRDLFNEFAKAKASVKTLKSHDLIQLSESLRKTLERIERALSDDEQSRGGGRR